MRKQSRQRDKPLSEKAEKQIRKWDKFRRGVERPSWDETFIVQAFKMARRSIDAQTQHGCVLVTQDNEVVTTGYNSFVRDIDDDILPNLRDNAGIDPAKYTWMIHSEHNAILNACRQGKSTVNTIAYVTGEPCINCFQYLYQAGIKEVVYTSFNKANMTSTDKDYETNVEIFLWLVRENMTSRVLDIEENYLKKLLGQTTS